VFLKVELIRYFLVNSSNQFASLAQMVLTRPVMPQILVRTAGGALCFFFFDNFFLQTCTTHTSILRAGVCRAECVHLSALHS